MRKKPSLARREKEALLARLDASLSDPELRRVLAGALLQMGDGARARLIARLGAEAGAALRSALEPPSGGKRRTSTAPVAGKGKTRQEWNRLWDEWQAVVDEACHEQGKYVVQEAHWEPPYLDTGSLSTDLDAVAARMRPLIGRMISDRIDPDFSFTEAIEALDEELAAGPPDGVEEDEPCCLGPAATTSLLEWEWAVARRDGGDAASFFDRIRDLETRLQHVELDPPSLRTFVFQLPHEHLRTLLESMTRQRTSKRWADAFTRASGCWAEVLRALSRRWNAALHAETCRANIVQDWTLALPLVTDAVGRRAFDEAATLIDEAVRSRLRLAEGERWDPRRELLVQRERFYCSEEERNELAALLRLWHQTAEGLRQGDLATALTLQITALRRAEDGDVMPPTLKKSAPKLLKLLSAAAGDERGRLRATRRSWCARLGADSLLPDLLAFWRNNVTRFVPDPGNTSADYTEPADWLAAAFEINPAAARELLARWAATYRLRRNLWRDLGKRGFSVGGR